MKTFALLALAGAAAAAPQYYIADTPEVQQAKIAFAQAYNAAASASQAALTDAGVNDFNPEDQDYSPAAEPYVHVEIPAEPYVHQEGPGAPRDEPALAPVAAPIQQAAPVAAPIAAPVQQQFVPAFNQFVPAQFNVNGGNPYNLNAFNQFYNQAFAAPAQAFVPQPKAAGGCYNWKGEGVECRTQF